MEGKELHIRQGELLDQTRPVNIDYLTNIFGPGEWFEKRKGLMDLDHCHIVVDEHGKIATITFNEKEREEYGNTIITGKLENHPTFANLQINHEFGSPESLGKHLKKNKRFFKDTIKGEELISALFNFKAHVEKRLEKNQDNRGNNRAVYESAIKTEIPQFFSLELPLFRGLHSHFIINFELCIAYADNKLVCWFESDNLDALLEEQRELIIDKELKRFDESIPVLRK